MSSPYSQQPAIQTFCMQAVWSDDDDLQCVTWNSVAPVYPWCTTTSTYVMSFSDGSCFNGTAAYLGRGSKKDAYKTVTQPPGFPEMCIKIRQVYSHCPSSQEMKIVSGSARRCDRAPRLYWYGEQCQVMRAIMEVTICELLPGTVHNMFGMHRLGSRTVNVMEYSYVESIVCAVCDAAVRSCFESSYLKVSPADLTCSNILVQKTFQEFVHASETGVRPMSHMCPDPRHRVQHVGVKFSKMNTIAWTTSICKLEVHKFFESLLHELNKCEGQGWQELRCLLIQPFRRWRHYMEYASAKDDWEGWFLLGVRGLEKSMRASAALLWQHHDGGPMPEHHFVSESHYAFSKAEPAFKNET